MDFDRKIYRRDFPCEESPFRNYILSSVYRFRLTSSSNKVSDTVIIRLFAWKPRCVVIMVVNSLDRSTLLISR